MIVQFPKRLKYVKCNPLVDFYTKCMKSSYNSKNLDNLNVTAFIINPKDYRKLKNLVNDYIYKNYPELSFKRKSFEASMMLLDIGPRVSKNVQEGTVIIMEDILYVSDFKNKE